MRFPYTPQAIWRREIIAFGAGCTGQQRQQPVGDTGRHEPRHLDAIVDVELQSALDDPDPLRGIAQLASRWAAAFVLDPDVSPALAAMHRDAVVTDDAVATTVRLTEHHSDSAIEDLNLDDD